MTGVVYPTADKVGKRIAQEYGIDARLMTDWTLNVSPGYPTKLTVELTMFPTSEQVDKFLGRAE